MARKPQQQTRADHAAAFRGRTPTNVEDSVDDGVADDPNPQRGAIAGQDRGGEDEDEAADAGEQRERKSPVQVGDDKRNAIFRRFNQTRGAVVADDQDGEDEGDDAGNGIDADADSQNRPDQPPQASAEQKDADAGEESDDDASDEPETFDLVVNGKTVQKSLKEVAQLAELSEDEVRENPDRAIKYARRELASLDRLEQSKKHVRETTSRSRDRSEDADADPGRSSARPQGEKTGSQDGASDQQDDRRNPTDDVDYQKLVEDIQIGSPEEAAEKLKDALEKVARKTTEKAVSQSKTVDALADEDHNRISAMRSVVSEHPEIKGNEVLVDALTGRIQREYRKDMRNAMIAEGTEPEEADAILAQATPAQILHAHRLRVIRRDPNVRVADKAFFDGIYKDVSAAFGNGFQQKQQQQQLENTRKGRKEQLRTQPRRSSVPPASSGQDAAVDPTAMRKAAFVQIRKSRGLKVR